MTAYTLVTNNPACRDRFSRQVQVLCQSQWSYLEVLQEVRRCIASGLVLVTHPLAGSLKPNQTPYRSVFLADRSLEDKEEGEDLRMIQNSIDNCRKFLNCRSLPDYSPEVKKDFAAIDLSFMESAAAQLRLYP